MKRQKTDIWFDFSNAPHVNLFRPMLNHFNDRGLKSFSTARSFIETTALLDKYKIEYTTFGRHGGKSRLKKGYNLIKRNLLLYAGIPDFKMSISSSFEAPEISWLRNRPAVVFDDNETAPNWLYSKFAKHVIAPSVIDIREWQRSGINASKIHTYDGFKEDIYVAGYTPDKDFLKSIPFDKFVTLRPENIFASYVPKDAKSIIPELAAALTREGYNILYLPRYEIDRSYIGSQPNIFVPEKPLNGLDVVFYSDAVLTGAGTFAREAAVLGTPAISFFAGSKLLAVDRSMITGGLIFHSRAVGEIIDYLRNVKKRQGQPDFSRSMKVKEEVFSILDKIYALYA